MDMFSPIGPLSTRIKGQKLNPQSTKNAPTFYRNLEEALDVRRANHTLFSIVQNTWQVGNAVDFCSNDILSLGSSGLLHTEFMDELTRYPEFTPGSGGSRLMDGNYTYLEQVEQEIADFHGAETGLIVGSGFEANVAIWTAIPRPGDVIVYDALVHASTHEGMNQSLAMEREEFRHNNVESFRSTLLSILDSQPLIKQGKRSVMIAVESVYSMDGDVCPLQELVDVAREIFPRGNAQFVVDEAHSTGVIGPKGAGFVCELGLEKEIAVRLHTYGKAMSASGGMVVLISMFIKSRLTPLSSYNTRQQNDQNRLSKLCAIYYILYSAFVSICRCNSSRIQFAEHWSGTRGKPLNMLYSSLDPHTLARLKTASKILLDSFFTQ
jgi:8-amino-7-oxononanoate synthase